MTNKIETGHWNLDRSYSVQPSEYPRILSIIVKITTYEITYSIRGGKSGWDKEINSRYF